MLLRCHTLLNIICHYNGGNIRKPLGSRPFHEPYSYQARTGPGRFLVRHGRYPISCKTPARGEPINWARRRDGRDIKIMRSASLPGEGGCKAASQTSPMRPNADWNLRILLHRSLSAFFRKTPLSSQLHPLQHPIHGLLQVQSPFAVFRGAPPRLPSRSTLHCLQQPCLSQEVSPAC